MNKIRIKTLADEGKRRAKNALYLSNNFDRSLTTILVGNNIVNIAAASIVTVLMANLWEKGLFAASVSEDDAAMIGTILTTALIFFFGEVTPKTLANDRPETMALTNSGFLRVIYKILYPLVSLFNDFNRLISKLFHPKVEPSITEEELYDIIDTAEEEGVMDEEQSDLFKSALDFSGTTAGDVMTMRGDICALDISSTNEEILQFIQKTNHSRIPVYRGTIDNIVGTLPIRIFIREYLKNEQVNVQSLLIKPFFVQPDAKIHDLLAKMRKHRFYLAVVSDAEHHTLGIVTIEDFLEELVGEIWDEDDVVDKNFTKLGGNHFLVNTHMTVGDAFARMGYHCREKRLATKPILSWLLETFGKMPQEEDSFTYNDVEIIVDTVEAGYVTLVEMKLNTDISYESLSGKSSGGRKKNASAPTPSERSQA